jgi:hypothetical protein
MWYLNAYHPAAEQLIQPDASAAFLSSLCSGDNVEGFMLGVG